MSKEINRKIAELDEWEYKEKKYSCSWSKYTGKENATGNKYSYAHNTPENYTTDLNEIMRVAKEWCDKGDKVKRFYALRDALDRNSLHLISFIKDENPAEALCLALLEADEGMKHEMKHPDSKFIYDNPIIALLIAFARAQGVTGDDYESGEGSE